MRQRLRKPLIPALIALIALGVGAELWYSRPLEKENAALQTSPAPADSPAPPPPLPSFSAAPSPPLRNRKPSPAPTPFAPPEEADIAEADSVNLMLRDYRTLAGENPVGTNAEIMAAVMGGNAKQATLGPPEGMKLNDKGELIDRWGTPYFFHQLSRDHMEIRAAGPDKILWTEDDPIIR